MSSFVGYYHRYENTFCADRALLNTIGRCLSSNGQPIQGTWVSIDRRIAFVACAVRTYTDTVKREVFHPLSDETGRSVVLFDGELYNAKALKDQLALFGHSVMHKSDVELVMLSYHQWGMKMLDYLEGSFSCAIFDVGSSEIFLIRDRFGERPLYFFLDRSIISFSTNMNAIWPLPWVTQQTDIAALEQYLIYRRVNAPFTFYKNMYQVPPGAYLIIGKACNVSIRFWYTPFTVSDNVLPVQQQEYDPLDRAYCGIERMLSLSIKKRIGSMSVVGAMISGGLDSAILAALIKRFIDVPYTFTISFREDNAGQEYRIARRLSQFFGMRHIDVLIDEDNLFEAIPEMVKASYEVNADPRCIVNFLAAKRMGQIGVRSVLTAEGIDELFGGHDKYNVWHPVIRLAWYISQAIIVKPIRTLMVDQATNYIGLPLANAYAMMGRFWRDGISINRCYPALFDRSGTSSIVRYADCTKLPSIQEEQRASSLTSISFSDYIRNADRSAISFLQGAFTTRSYQMAIASNVVLSFPCLDYRLAHYLVAYYDSQRIRHTSYFKSPMRTIGQRLLPYGIAQRRHTRMVVPFSFWFRQGTVLRKHFYELLDDSTNGWHEICDVEEIKRMLNAHQQGKIDSAEQLWALYLLFAHQKFV